MKKSLLIKRISILLPAIVAFWQIGFGQAVLVENFDYASGALLTTNGWSAHSGSGTQAIDVIVPGLTFTGYPSSNIGGAAQIDNTGEDVNKAFTTQTTGTTYSAFLIKVNTPADGYFLNLGGTPIGTTFRSKLFTIGTSSPFNFGLSVGSNTATPISGGSYTSGTTYLCVLKYEVVSGTNNDIVSLFVISGEIPATEPATPTAGPLTDASQTDINPGSIALRQFVATQNIIIDGIRIATNWTDAISDIKAPVATFVPTNSATDVSISAAPTITFDEAVVKADGSELTNADLATLITFKKTDASGANVSFTGTIDATKKIITITPVASLDNSQIYYMAVGPVKDSFGNLSTTSEITFTTIAAASPTVTLTNPVGGETFYANDPVSFTWTSENITYLQMEVWVPDQITQIYDWEPLGIPIPAVAGKLDFVIPADAPYGSGYKIRISDAGNPAVNSTSGAFTLIAVASSITDLRARCIVNDIVRLSSEATVTYLRTNRNQKYIQDSEKGLLIDDAAHVLTTTLAPGDNIAGLEGKLALYHGVLELVPTKPSVTIASSGNIVTPPQMTIADYKTNYLNYESMLIKLTNVIFDAGNGTATFAAATNYQISDGANSVTFRTFNADETDIDGEIIPVSRINMTCVAGFFDATIQVYSQTKSEFELITAIERTSDLKTEIYPVPAADMLKVRNLKDIKDYEILDATGRTISKSKVATDNELNIPVSELKHGIYYVRFNTSGGVVVKKFVK